MHITKVSIRNFRNFRNVTFHFRKGVNTLIGENGSGKTNAFYAMRLLIDDSLSRRSINLSESDFNRALGEWYGHWIIISVDFDELDTSEGCQVIRHSVGHMTTENKGTYTFIFRPKKEVRLKLFEMSVNNDNSEDIESYLRSITIEQYESIFTGRATANICDEETYTRLVGDFEEYDFPDPNKEDTNEIGVNCPQLHYEVSCTFAKALRDVVADLHSYRDNPLLGLLRGTEKNIEVEESQKIIDEVKNLNDEIGDLEEIQKLSVEQGRP